MGTQRNRSESRHLPPLTIAAGRWLGKAALHISRQFYSAVCQTDHVCNHYFHFIHLCWAHIVCFSHPYLYICSERMLLPSPFRLGTRYESNIREKRELLLALSFPRLLLEQSEIPVFFRSPRRRTLPLSWSEARRSSLSRSRVASVGDLGCF